MRQPPPVGVDGNRIRAVRITRSGWAFIGITLALGLAAMNSGMNLLYLVFGMLLSMLVLNAILSRASLHNLSVQFVLPQRLYASSRNPLHIQLSNHKTHMPSYALTLTPVTERKRAERGHFTFKVDPGGSHDFMHLQTYPVRGRHALPEFRLHSSYPFGLIEKYIPVRPEGSRVIYPEVRDTGRQLLPSLVTHGDRLAGQRGDGADPYGIREFRPGDEMRRVHWPSVAKSGNWMSKEFEQEKRTRVTVNVLTREDASDQHNAAREAAITGAASLLVQCVQEGREVGLMIDSQRREPHGGGYIDFYLNALALFDTEPDAIGGTVPESRGPDDGMVLAFAEDPSSVRTDAIYDLLANAEERSA